MIVTVNCRKQLNEMSHQEGQLGVSDNLTDRKGASKSKTFKLNSSAVEASHPNSSTA
jgi:hypothetical protein